MTSTIPTNDRSLQCEVRVSTQEGELVTSRARWRIQSVVVSVLLLGVFLLFGCGRYFTPNINLDRYATLQEIVGTWTLRPDTLLLAQRDGYKPSSNAVHQIEFEQDGSCAFRSIINTGLTDSLYLVARGRWRLEHDTHRKDERERKNELFLELDKQEFKFLLTEEDGRILLWDFWGDPDSWEFIKYERSDFQHGTANAPNSAH